MNFYLVEQSLEIFKKLNKDIKRKAVLFDSKELIAFVSLLDELFKTDFYEPRITRLMFVKKEIDYILQEVLLQVPSFNPKMAKFMAEKIPFITSSLNVWVLY